ncbi:putative two-component histidine kinase [Streptomyces sp. NBRC 110611]|uniref:sensor histidine kinase n=1 Tax=Streptomyces sp. NBRC 110611 TaxID=1621259 RepID=UPI0008589EA3|nr:ATP-binding protein [Streptomyces sp. NBRC 110611]GAU65541.1 putative two-component histidine kinase [Streptomyces sp. NBRC 110611]
MRLPRPRARPRPSRRLRGPRSLAGQLFAMQVVLVTAVVTGCAGFAYVNAGRQAEETARRQATAAATAVAGSPAVVAAARTADPTAALQPYTERLRRDAGVDFVVVMAPDGTRWTHPQPSAIGGKYLGHTGPALDGRVFAETHPGVLGPSVRVVAPVHDPRRGGRITALVSSGITIETISAQLRDQLLAVAGVAAAALALGGAGTYVINARLRRHTHGMNARELSRMHDYHQAALHAVREGLLMLDGRRRVALVNDGGRELLGLPGDAVGRPVGELGLPGPLTEALLAPGPRRDELHLTAERVLVVNSAPVSGGDRRGSVVTLRDHTELQALAGELDSVRGFAEALRSQAHEAANRLHTVVSLIELGRAEEAVGFATAELELAQALTDRVVAAVAEPVLAALLLGKAAQAHERGVELTLTPDSRIDDGVLPPGLPARDLVTVLGNLVDNAIDAAAPAPAAVSPVPGPAAAPAAVSPAPALDAAPEHGAVEAPRVRVTARAADGELLLRVADNGPGVATDAAEEIFRRGWSTKQGAGRGLGLALARQATRRNGGTLTLDRAPAGGARFTVRLPLRAEEAGRCTTAEGRATAEGCATSECALGTCPSGGAG